MRNNFECDAESLAALSRGFRNMSRAFSNWPMRQIGEWFIAKYRKAAADNGFRHAAARLRKDGVPFNVALMTLLNTEERFEYLHKGVTHV